MMPHVMACILAGGEGTRLRPLTAQRAKPAVRFAGSYRLIDFSLSNCLNSHLRKILVFPQYQAPSLEHHLRKGWSFLSAPLGEYVRSLPPQLQVDPHGYRGTADALYQNLATLDRLDPRAVLILGGDHVYYLDYRDLLAFHHACQADVTVGTFPVPAQHAHHFGILTVDPCGVVTAFVEKPTARFVTRPYTTQRVSHDGAKLGVPIAWGPMKRSGVGCQGVINPDTRRPYIP